MRQEFLESNFRTSRKSSALSSKSNLPATMNGAVSISFRFYVNPKSWNIKKELKDQLSLMDEKKMRYDIFEDTNLLLPMMSYEGNVVAGSANIARILSSIIIR